MINLHWKSHRSSDSFSIPQDALEQHDRIDPQCLSNGDQLRHRHLTLIALDHANDGMRSSHPGGELSLGKPDGLAGLGYSASYGAGSKSSEGFQICSDFQSTSI